MAERFPIKGIEFDMNDIKCIQTKPVPFMFLHVKFVHLYMSYDHWTLLYE